MAYKMTNKDVVRAMALAIQTPGLVVGSRKVPGVKKPEKIQVLGLPCLLWGPPGVAKTAFVNQITEVLNEIDPGWHPTPITVLASIREPADFLGLPLPEGGGVNRRSEPLAMPDGTVVPPGGRIPAEVAMAPPDWARQLNALTDDPGPANVGKGRKAVLFLDEFTTAPPSVQAAMLRVVHERVVGDLRLHTNVAIIAAANPPWMSPGGESLDPPTVNRFLHFDWKPPSKEAWANYVTRGAGLSDAEKEKLEKEGKEWVARISGIDIPILNRREYSGWLEAISIATAKIIKAKKGGLLGVKEKGKKDQTAGKYDPKWADYAPLFNMPRLAYFRKNDQEDFDALRYAWPSPRSWELAVAAVAATKSTYSIMTLTSGPRAGESVKLKTGADLDVLVSVAAVGDPLGREYVQALKRQDIHPPQEYVEQGRPFQKGNIDVTRTALASVINYGLENPDRMAATVKWLEDNSSAVRGHEGWSKNWFNSTIMKQFRLWAEDKGPSLKRHNPDAYRTIIRQMDLLRKRIEGQKPPTPVGAPAGGFAIPFDA